MPKKSTKQVKECEPESDSGELELLNDDELEEAINNKSSKSESKKVKAKKGEKPIKAVEPRLDQRFLDMFLTKVPYLSRTYEFFKMCVTGHGIESKYSYEPRGRGFNSCQPHQTG